MGSWLALAPQLQSAAPAGWGPGGQQTSLSPRSSWAAPAPCPIKCPVCTVLGASLHGRTRQSDYRPPAGPLAPHTLGLESLGRADAAVYLPPLPRRDEVLHRRGGNVEAARDGGGADAGGLQCGSRGAPCARAGGAGCTQHSRLACKSCGGLRPGALTDARRASSRAGRVATRPAVRWAAGRAGGWERRPAQPPSTHAGAQAARTLTCRAAPEGAGQGRALPAAGEGCPSGAGPRQHRGETQAHVSGPWLS